MEISENKKKYKTRDVLLVASYYTKHEGYKPVSSGKDSTKERVLLYLNNHSSVDDLTEYQERAEQAVQWVKNEKSTDWIDNLRSSLMKKEIDDSAVGLVASVFSGYDHHVKKLEDRKQLLNSNFVGQPKDNITIDVKSSRHITSGKSKFNDNKDFHILQIIDQSGNVYIWFADQDYSDDLAKSKTVRAIVKSHNERDGVKQTVVQVTQIE